MTFTAWVLGMLIVVNVTVTLTGFMVVAQGLQRILNHLEEIREEKETL